MIIGDSPEMRRALYLAERFAPTKEPVLVVGARGTGKELLARHIHDQSGRRGKFVDVNCGAIPPGLAESLLFGHERGAFTDARGPHVGWLEDSDGGTLFLDEFADLPPECQVKALRAIESGEVRPVGGRTVRRVDLRVVAAVQDDVWARLAAGTLRADLLDRVAVGVIHLPLLRVRGADLETLAVHFAGQEGRSLEPGVVQILQNYPWPGNVRELRAVITRAGCLVNNGTLSPAAVAEALALGTVMRPGRRAHADEADELRQLCEQCEGDVERVGRALGLRRTAVYDRLRKHGIAVRDYRPSGVPDGRRTDGPDGGILRLG